MCYAHLFSTIRGKVKHQHGQEGDAHAWDDQVDCVEQGLTPHGDVEGDVQVGFVTACVKLDIPEICGGRIEITVVMSKKLILGIW